MQKFAFSVKVVARMSFRPGITLNASLGIRPSSWH